MDECVAFPEDHQSRIADRPAHPWRQGSLWTPKHHASKAVPAFTRQAEFALHENAGHCLDCKMIAHRPLPHHHVPVVLARHWLSLVVETPQRHMRRDMTTKGTSRLTAQRCAETCLDCYKACTHALYTYLERGSDQAEHQHITVLMDCAQVCRMSADMLLRDSPRHHLTCGLCAAFCEQCAKECAQGGDASCAESCRQCAHSCHLMAMADVSLPYNVM
jgi:hypothetical protein